MKKINVCVLAIAMAMSMCLLACTQEQKPLTKIQVTELSDAYTRPDDYKGRPIGITGKAITDVQDFDGIQGFEMLEDVENSSNLTLVVTDKDIHKGDFVSVEGVCGGLVEVEKSTGGYSRAMKVTDATVVKSSAEEVVSPTKSTLCINETVEHSGVSITLEKIEFSKDETRVYLAVSNNGSYPYNLWGFDCIAKQNTKEFKTLDNPAYKDLKDLSEQIPCGGSASGFIVFSNMESATDTKLVLKGDLDKSYNKIEDFVFDINPSTYK